VARVVITASADSDAAAIVSDLTAKAGIHVANRFADDFDAFYRRLELFPESGALRPRLGPLVRIGVVAPYAIIHEYVAVDDVVTIMRIVHGRRRITPHMLIRPTPIES